jgi:ankyrin repeat protein
MMSINSIGVDAMSESKVHFPSVYVLLHLLIAVTAGAADLEIQGGEPVPPMANGLYDSEEGQNTKKLVQAALLPGPDGVEALRRIVNSGVSVDSQARDGSTALTFFAVRNDKVDVVRELIALGADVNHCSVAEPPALSRAVSAGAYDVAVELLNAKASVKLTSLGIGEPLHYACGNVCSAIYPDVERRSNAKCIDLLIRHGADIRALCPQRRSCLHHAVLYGNEETVAHLLKTYGAKFDLNARDKHGQTPLMSLLTPPIIGVPRNKMKDREMVAIASELLRYGADPYLTDPTRKASCFDAFTAANRWGSEVIDVVNQYRNGRVDPPVQ